MKPKSAFRLVRAGSRRLAIALVTLLAAQAVPADTIYWDGTGTDWAAVASWSTQPGATTPDPAFIPGFADLATFSISGVNTAQTVNLNGNRSVLGLSFLGSNSAATALLGGGTARMLTLGTSGLTLAANAGAVTLGDGTAGNNVFITLASGDQTWTNNSAAAFTINNTAATFTRAVGATLDFNQAGAGAFVMSTTVLPNDATGIIGPWASFGTGVNTKYAYNNAGVIAGLTGTAAATAANVTDTTGTLNYDVAAIGALGTGANFNTLRYTGAAGSITGTWTANGLMNVSSGVLTLSGAGTIGAGKELVVNTATANAGITFSSAIANNPLGASMLTKTGAGTLTVGNSNTYTGKTVINGGTLKIAGGDTTTAGAAAPLGAYPGSFQADNVTINNGGTLYAGAAMNVTQTNRGITLGAGTAGILMQGGQNEKFYGVISGSGNLSITATGNSSRAWFSAPMTYSGTTNINAYSGTLFFGDAASINNDGSLVNSPSMILGCSAVWQNIGNTTYAGVISGSGSNAQIGGTPGGVLGNAAVALGDGYTASIQTAARGTLTLTGSNIYTVGTVINSGGITLAGSGNLGNNANALWIGYGVLDLGTKSITQNGGVWLTDGTLKNGTLTSSGGFTLNSAGTNGGFVASANLAGGTTLTKSGAGKATLSGTNTYTGITTLTLGTLNLGSAENAGVSGPLGNPTAPANSIVLNGGYLQYSGANQYDYSGRFSTAASQAYNADTNGQSVTWATSLTSSGGSLTKSGAGTLTLTGTGNTYAGATTVNGGTLLLDVSAGGTLSSSSALALGGGIFSIKGTGTTNQTVASLALNAGGSGIAINPNGGTTTLTITSNTLTNAAGGAVNFNTSAGTPSTAMIAWSPSLTGGIIGGGFTMTDNGGTGFATINTGKVVRFTPGTVLDATNPTSATTDFLTNTTSTITNTVATAALNSLTIDTSAGANIWDLVTGNMATLSTGGLLMTGANNFAIQNGTLMSGTATNSDLIINQMGAGTLSISSLIANGSGASTLTKNGSGALVLNGTVTNTYTGSTFVNAGSLTVNAYASNKTGLGSGAVAIAAGATLTIQTNGQGPTIANTFSGAGTLNLAFTSNNNLTANNISGMTGTIHASRTDAFDGYHGTHVWNCNASGTVNAALVLDAGTALNASSSVTFAKGITITGYLSTDNGQQSIRYTGTFGGNITVMTNAAFQSTLANGTSYVTGNITSGAASGTQVVQMYSGSDFRESENFTGNISDGTTGGQISIAQNYHQNVNLAILSGLNTYTGATYVMCGVLRANDGVGLPAGSNLTIAGPSVFETSANLVRPAGSGAGQMQLLQSTPPSFWNASGDNNGSATGTYNGFNAVINPVVVCFGTLGSPTALTWGSGSFNPGTTGLYLNWSLGTYTATIGSNIEFKNPIDLAGAVRSIEVDYKTAMLSGVLSGTGSSGLTKVGVGTLALTAANTYAGKTSIQNGILSVASLNYVSAGDWTGHATGSNLGLPNNSANGTLDFGASGNAGQLTYTGTGETTDRILNLAGTTGGAVIDQSGAGLLKFTGINTAGGAGSKTLTLQGSTSGSGEISGALVNNSVSNLTSLTKAGTGTWTLSGANTYTGATNINAGKLLLGAGGAMGATAVGVTGGATYGTSYTTSGNTIAGGASLSLANGTFLDLQDSTTNTLAFTGAATLSGATLKLDLGTAQADQLSLGAAATSSPGNVISLHMLGGTLATGVGAYTLLSDSAGGLTLGNFGLASTTLGSYTLALSGGGNTIYLDVSGGGGGGTPTQSFVFSAPANPVNARPGAGVSLSGTLSNTGAGSLAVSLASTGTLNVTGLGSSVSPIANGSPGTVTGTIQTGTAAGPQVWGVTNTDGAATNTTATISGTINVYDLANARYSGSTLAFGNVHQGASVSNQSVAIGNQTVTAAGYQDLLDVAAITGNAKVTATGFSGLAASTSGATTNNLSFSVNTGTVGSLAGTASLTLTSNANSVAGLGNGTATVVGTPTAITTTGNVYSGLMVWNGGSAGTWTNNANWNDSADASVHAAPGLDGGFTAVDTATFGNTTGSVAVNVDAAAHLNALSFTGTGNYTLAGAGSIALAGTAAGINVTSGTQAIGTPLTLAHNAAVAVNGGTLTISGAISGSGMSLTKTGAGTLALSNASGNSYDGGTAVSGTGTLLVNNTTGSGTGSGAVTVGAGSTLGGTGSIAGAVNVTGILSPGGSIVESLASGALTLNSGSTFIYQATSGTLADLMVVNGGLVLTSVTLDLTGATSYLASGALGDKLTLLSYTGTPVTGGFNSYTDDATYLFGSGVTAKAWTFNYNDTVKGNNTPLEATGTSFVTVAVDAYFTWAASKGLTHGVNDAANLDADSDGVVNLAEFAFDGDPLNPANRGLIYTKSGVNVLNFTCAVRTGTGSPSFSPDANNAQTATVDGVTYTIEASTTLTGTWNTAVTHTGSSTTPPVGSTGWPNPADAGWEYHTFSAAPVGGKVFLRAKAVK